MIIFVLGMFFWLLSGSCFAGCYDWVPYNNNMSPPIIEVPATPSITYTTKIITRPTLTYILTPVYINKPIIINNYGILCNRQQIIYQPTIEWVYQPYLIK